MEENVMKGKDLWNAKGDKTVQERKPASRGQALQRALVTILGAVLLIGAMVATLCAQSYPTKPIRFIIPQPPGGGFDLVGRIIGPKLSERLGQPVVTENRPGAGTTIGAEVVSRAKPDGYTIMQCGATFVISPSMYKKINFNPIKDFAPISLVAQMQNLLVVTPSLPFKNLKELVEYAKANPGKLNYGSGGVGTPGQLANELLKSLAKIDIVHVSYSTLPQSLIAVMTGEVNMMSSGVAQAMPQIQAGKVRAFMVFSNERLPSLPNVPTPKEAGIDNLDVIQWYGLLAPAGTPRDIIRRLNAEWVRIAAMPDTMEQMQKVGVEPMSSTPEQLSEFIKVELARWAKVIKEANIKGFD